MSLSSDDSRGDPSRADATRGAVEMVALEHDAANRAANVVVILGPFAALLLAGWLAWGGSLHWQDLLVLAITYSLTGLGITVGYHRLFTHRSPAGLDVVHITPDDQRAKRTAGAA
jgi:hypothetical protein